MRKVRTMDTERTTDFWLQPAEHDWRPRPTLTGRDHTSLEVWDEERERIWWGDWVAFGRSEEVAASGDYVVRDVAGESVFVVRNAEGRVNGFYNVCSHRGTKFLDDDDRGNRRKAFTCPYHAWTYDLDGRLIGTPNVQENELFDRSSYPLHPVAVDEYAGFVFVNLADRPRPLMESLTQGTESMTAFERFAMQDLRIGVRIVYEVEANWKVILENYNECYHCDPVHPELCRLVPAFKQRGGSELDWERGIPHREGAWTFTETGTTNRRPFDGLNADEQVRHKGELVYPNFMISLSADHVTAYTVWPREPGHTTIVCDFLFHPSELARSDFNPADAVDFWDLVNHQDWAICENVQRGMQSRMFQQGYYAPMESASLDIRRYVAEKLEGGVRGEK
jgi:Rieske 2Fe-2S family protein